MATQIGRHHRKWPVVEGVLASTEVTPLHLAREVVYADMRWEHALRDCLWDWAETWQAYREQLIDWRFGTLRGWPPGELVQCFCGRVSRFPPGQACCFGCGTRMTVP